jgi:alpha-L-arabinofuranosidase
MSGGVTTYYVKIVNPSTQLLAARISFTGVTSIDRTATQAVLTGSPGARNRLAAPNAIVPRASSVTVANGQRFAFPTSSVTILRITAK